MYDSLVLSNAAAHWHCRTVITDLVYTAVDNEGHGHANQNG
jgi:hypothetical protein